MERNCRWEINQWVTVRYIYMLMRIHFWTKTTVLRGKKGMDVTYFSNRVKSTWPIVCEMWREGTVKCHSKLLA